MQGRVRLSRATDADPGAAVTRARAACAALLLCMAAGARGDQPLWLPFSYVMSEVSHEPGFVDAVLEKLGRDPRAPGILGPKLLGKLKSLLLGRHFEKLDRFPGFTIGTMGSSVAIAARMGGRDKVIQPWVDPDARAPASEALGIPTGGAPPDPSTYMRVIGWGLDSGDRLDPGRAARCADSARLGVLLTRLARNPDGAPTHRVTLDGIEVTTPRALIAQLMATGHDVRVSDARYFANFGDLTYRGEDVFTGFWVNTLIAVPGTSRALLVPVGHSQHEIEIRGPVVNADLAFYFGIDGEVAFRTNETKDQSWVLGRQVRTYRGDDALEVVRFAGAIIRTYGVVKRAHPDLPFGGYWRLGVCNDVNAMVETHMQGAPTLYPLTVDASLFPDDEVGAVARRLPVDARGDAPPDVKRIRGSIPVEKLEDLPMPRLRDDLLRVRLAAHSGTLETIDPRQWLRRVVMVVVLLAAVLGMTLIVTWRRLRGTCS